MDMDKKLMKSSHIDYTRFEDPITTLNQISNPCLQDPRLEVIVRNLSQSEVNSNIVKFLAQTNQNNEKTKAILESRSGDLVTSLGDFFIDVHYKDQRNKLRNPDQVQSPNKELDKKKITDPKDSKASQLQPGTPAGGIDFSKLLQNPSPQPQPPQNPSSGIQNIQNMNTGPTSFEQKPKEITKPASPLAGILGGHKKADKPRVSFDLPDTTVPQREEPKLSSQFISPNPLPTIPEQQSTKPAQNLYQPPPKIAAPFFGNKPSYLDEEDDPLSGSHL